ncbi:hypothetical protein EV361DRAFT_982354 [Lentinula raphanica]|uniref:Uncharacterized protein n=1 Tax=Lentinula raphanica TaxID=153919 RepID=A0AA38UG99_9AGAR|nr:hypothetical protein F5878DRAFT_659749 [Lentinula raphanica]KAJ3963933.1 hypothetical protein EV361DRAFT_982354 [Lentinula raphanica]
MVLHIEAALHTTPRTKPDEFLTPSASKDPPSDAGPSTSTLPPSMSMFALHQLTQTCSPTAQASLSILVTSKPPSQTRSSPAPSALSTIPLTSSPTLNKESSNATKERHPSPYPLSTSNANIEGDRTMAGAAAMDKNKMSGPVSDTTTSPAPKAVKRAAAGGGAAKAEKRKKALHKNSHKSCVGCYIT